MKPEIVKFIQEACQKYKLEAYFIPETQVYTLTKKGRAVQNFNAQQFYSYPKKRRMWEYNALIRAGLSHNLGERHTKEQIFLPRKFGIKIA